MMNTNTRKFERVPAEMKLRSVSLPYYNAEIVDISTSGARIKLKGNSTPLELLECRIRFGVSLPTQLSPQFEGFARVVWIQKTENGLEAGLQWEKLTEEGWKRAQAVIEQLAA